MHDGDGAAGEIDDLLGHRSEEVRVQTGKSTGADHQMPRVTGSRDQSLRGGNVERVRFDDEIVGNAGRGDADGVEQLVKHTFRLLLAHVNRRDRILVAFDDAEILQLPAEYDLQGSVMQYGEIDGEQQRVLRTARTVDADHDRTLILRQGRAGKLIGDRAAARGERIGDGVLNA